MVARANQTAAWAGNSRCPIKFMFCSGIALFQLAEFLFESREFRLLTRDGALRVVQPLGEG